MARKRSRYFLTIGILAILAAALVFAFWPRPLKVDIGRVKQGEMVVTIDEEGRTRVHDTFVVSTPVAGRLLRVDVEPGDPVTRRESIVAEMRPANPEELDVRAREQARAAVAAAKAAVRASRAELNQAMADADLASAALKRARELHEKNTLTQAALDNAIRDARAASAAVASAEADIAMREAELENAQARLISFNDLKHFRATTPGREEVIPISAPITGRVLRVLQRSETTLPAGTPILEIGNIENDLEVVVELLSTDAVQVEPGDRVLIAEWGGAKPLEGVVERVDPWGFTKFSALGVEEQRVNAIITFTDASKPREAGLGHGFRVETRIVVWEDDSALIVPSSALFREGADWAVFVVENGKAAKRLVEIGRNNGIQAQVLEGLSAGDQVVLYPSSGLSEGVAVEQRQIR